MSDGKERILRIGFAEGPGERPQRRSLRRRGEEGLLRRRFAEEPRVRRRRSMPEGEETSDKPQSGEDEEFYTVRLTIYPKPVLGLPDPFAGQDRRRDSAELYEHFRNRRDVVERNFKEAAGRWEVTGDHDPHTASPSTVKFTLRKLDIVPRGSFTLIAILGAVYVGVKDYEVVRRSLLAIARDMENTVTRILVGRFPPGSKSFSPSYLWAIDSEVTVGTPSPIPQPAGVSGEAPTPAPTPVVHGSPQAPPQGGSNWAARHAFILYLAITNVVLIVLLGLLLMRAAFGQ